MQHFSPFSPKDYNSDFLVSIKHSKWETFHCWLLIVLVHFHCCANLCLQELVWAGGGEGEDKENQLVRLLGHLPLHSAIVHDSPSLDSGIYLWEMGLCRTR